MVTSEQHRHAPRLRPGDRELQILTGAETFFAEHGFDGTTRQLADYLGVQQSLIFRYFPTKQALIDRIYEDIFEERWDPAWPEIITDRSLSLQERLTRFYTKYTKATVTREWLRLFYQAGLKGYDFNERYQRLLRRDVFLPLCSELRLTYGIPPLPASESPSEIEMQLITGLHGTIVYPGVREFIYGLSETSPECMEIWIESFVNYAAPAAYRKLASQMNRVEANGKSSPA